LVSTLAANVIQLVAVAINIPKLLINNKPFQIQKRLSVMPKAAIATNCGWQKICCCFFLNLIILKLVLKRKQHNQKKLQYLYLFDNLRYINYMQTLTK
jgi:hypothetical protein